MLSQLDLSEIWGISKGWKTQLLKAGIRTPLELRDYNAEALKKMFNVVVARIALELRGISCFDLEEEVQPKKVFVPHVLLESMSQPLKIFPSL